MLVAIKKYEFYIIKIEFCGFIMELNKLSIDLKKITVLCESAAKVKIKRAVCTHAIALQKRFYKHQK